MRQSFDAKLPRAEQLKRTSATRKVGHKHGHTKGPGKAANDAANKARNKVKFRSGKFSKHRQKVIDYWKGKTDEYPNG